MKADKGGLNTLNKSYVIITPAKDEAQFIENTIQSVCKQTCSPLQWIIVDDGSSDGTATIVEKYAKQHEWITLVRNASAAMPRAGGSKIIKAFNEGFKEVRSDSWGFIVKLDADLILPEKYFEEVIKCFSNDSQVGICGGYCVNQKGDAVIAEKAAEFHVRGAFKAYRKECFEAIGGIPLVWDWDGLDQLKAMYLGWKTKVLPLAVVHCRETSSAYGKISQKHRAGREYYRMRHGAILALLKSAYYAGKKPVVLGAAVFLEGFAQAWICREKPLVSEDLGKYIRKFQYRRVLRQFTSILKGREKSSLETSK
jgi:glycosyltransferase involved in cell wall biosynthesis